MRRILLMVVKDLRIFLSDPVALGLSLVVPFVMILVFGLVFGRSGKDPVGELRILTLNLDQGPGGRRLIRSLDALDELAMRERLRDDTTRVDSVRAYQLVRDGSFSAALIIPQDFSEGLRQGQLRARIYEDPADPVTAGVLVGLLQKQAFETFPMLIPSAMMGSMLDTGTASLVVRGFNKDLKRALEKNFDLTFPDSVRSFADLIPEDMLLGDTTGATDSSGFSMGEAFERVNRIEREEVVGQDVVNPGIAQSTAGVAVMFLLFGVGAIAASLLREMHKGTASRLLLSGASSHEILLSKSLYAVLFGTFQLSLMMLFGWAVFGLQIFVHPFALLTLIVVTAITMSGVGLVIAAFARTEEQAAGLQIVLIMSMSAIGGAMVPSFLIPEAVRTVAMATPVHWAMQGFTDIFWRQKGIEGILSECGILLAMAVVLMTASAVAFRRRLGNELG
jgi:ABC-2 type transport system permease protein